MKKLKCFYVCLFLLLGAAFVFSPHPVYAQGKSDKVKAVFLFKFFDYVTWPPGKKPGESGDGYLCTYGRHSFADSLDYIAARKSGKYRLRTKSISSLDDAESCHVLFVTRGNYGEISSFNNNGVLVVGDSGGVLERGGAVELQESGGKVGLVVDLHNAKKRGLKISSRLLDIADVRR